MSDTPTEREFFEAYTTLGYLASEGIASTVEAETGIPYKMALSLAVSMFPGMLECTAEKLGYAASSEKVLAWANDMARPEVGRVSEGSAILKACEPKEDRSL